MSQPRDQIADTARDTVERPTGNHSSVGSNPTVPIERQTASMAAPLDLHSTNAQIRLTTADHMQKLKRDFNALVDNSTAPFVRKLEGKIQALTEQNTALQLTLDNEKERHELEKARILKEKNRATTPCLFTSLVNC
jgi:hypothetical protein